MTKIIVNSCSGSNLIIDNLKLSYYRIIIHNSLLPVAYIDRDMDLPSEQYFLNKVHCPEGSSVSPGSITHFPVSA